MVKRFRDVDAAPDPAQLVQYLDGVRERPDEAERTRIMLELMGLQPGGVALDAGCGAGNDVMAMAGVVGGSGRAVGIDASLAMVTEARKRAGPAAVNAEFHVGDLSALEFPDGTFDACHTERVLIHVESPLAAIRELIRVTRPGGRVVACETDFGAAVVDSPHPEVRRKIVAWNEEVGVRNAWMGRQLRRRFMEQGLNDVDVVVRPMLRVPPLPQWLSEQVIETANKARDDGYLTSAEAATYLSWFDSATSDGTYLMVGLMFVVAGTVPHPDTAASGR